MSRLDNVDLRLLRIFLAVVEARGFSAAQTQLNVSASTVSNHITALETRLGMRLCQRGRAGFRLTPDGETVYGETQKLFAAMEDFDLKIGGLNSRARTSLVIGTADCTATDSSSRLHVAISRLVGQFKDIQITLETRPPNELLREMVEGRIDVTVGSFPKLLLGLTYLKLYEERQLFYCGRSHPLFNAPAEAITLEALARHRAVSRIYWARRDIRHLQSEHPPAIVNSMEAAAQLIRSGCFLGYLPEHYAAHWVANGEMRVLLPDELTYNVPFEVAFTETARQRKAVRIFVDTMLAAMEVEAAP